MQGTVRNKRRVVGCVMGVLLSMGPSLGCTKVITVAIPEADGNRDYWVCEGGEAESCRGELEGDTDPAGYQHRMLVVSTPSQCPNGVATMDIVVRRGSVKRVRYQCAQRGVPTGLPEAAPSAGSEGPGWTGLPAGVDDETALEEAGAGD